MANISPSDLGRLTVPLPPLELQEKFARFVRSVEEIRNQMLSKLGNFSELQAIVSQQTLSGALTAKWRESHAAEVADAGHTRETLLRARGANISFAGSAKIISQTRENLTSYTARHWLLGELGEFQRQVLAAFTEYSQQSDEPLLVEDPEVFSRFCDDAAVYERLQAFGYSHGNRIRRSLSQLAALGLIAKVTLPKQDQESGELDYLKAFRLLRPEEFTRMADVQAIRKVFAENVTQLSYYFEVNLDFETSERVGADGMFHVISIEDENGKDFTGLVDQGRHYSSLDQLKEDLSLSLKVEAQYVELEVI